MLVKRNVVLQKNNFHMPIHRLNSNTKPRVIPLSWIKESRAFSSRTHECNFRHPRSTDQGIRNKFQNTEIYMHTWKKEYLHYLIKQPWFRQERLLLLTKTLLNLRISSNLTCIKPFWIQAVHWRLREDKKANKLQVKPANQPRGFINKITNPFSFNCKWSWNSLNIEVILPLTSTTKRPGSLPQHLVKSLLWKVP